MLLGFPLVGRLAFLYKRRVPQRMGSVPATRNSSQALRVQLSWTPPVPATSIVVQSVVEPHAGARRVLGGISLNEDLDHIHLRPHKKAIKSLKHSCFPPEVNYRRVPGGIYRHKTTSLYLFLLIL